MKIETIKQNVNTIDIYAKLLDIPTPSAGQQRLPNIKSPFRHEKTGSFSIFQKNGEWFWKDHGTDEGGDVFKLWEKLKNKTFAETLQDIAKEFNIADTDRAERNAHAPETDPLKIWKVTEKPYTRAAVEFWAAADVTEKDLKKYGVVQVDTIRNFSAKQNRVRDWKQGECIAFEFGTKSHRIFYRPKQTIGEGEDARLENKVFMKHIKDEKTPYIFGAEQLPPYKVELLIIAAGEKDCIALNANGFRAVTLGSEAAPLSPLMLKSLKRKAYNIAVLYDNDDTGKAKGAALCEKYGLLNLTGLLFEEKDSFDYFAANPKGAESIAKKIQDELETYKDGRNLSIWEYKNCYYSKKGNAKVSNFIIETLAYIEGKDNGAAKRVFRLIHENGKPSRTQIAEISIFLSAEKFGEYIQNYMGGEFLFFGTSQHLKEIQVLADFGLDENLKEVVQGENDPAGGAFAFANGIFTDGKFHKPDGNGIAAGYYLQDLQTEFEFKDSSFWTVNDFQKSIIKMYGETNAFWGFAYLTASLIYDYAMKERQTKLLKMFPILSLYGPKGSGKTYLATTTMALIGDTSPLERATPKALGAMLSQGNNAPLIFDELNIVNNWTIETLKSIANGTGFTNKAFSNDNATKTYAPSRPLITAGQLLLSDEALLSRCIVCKFKVMERTDQINQEFRYFETEKTKGFGRAFAELYKHRDRMKADFKETYYNTIDLLNKYIDEENVIKSVDIRLLNNIAAIVTPLRIAIKNGLILPYSQKPIKAKILGITAAESPIFEFAMEKLSEQKAMQEVQDTVDLFVSRLPLMIRSKHIEFNFDISVNDTEVFFRPHVFDKYIAYCKDNAIQIFERATDLKNYIKDKSYFVKYGNKTLVHQSKCFILDKEKLEQQEVYFYND